MLSSSQLGLAAALLPAALACLGYEGGVPTPTDTISSSAVIEIAAGDTFDAGWAKYDRGSGACKEQTEGGKYNPMRSQYNTLTIHGRLGGCCFLPSRWRYAEECHHWR